MPVIQLKRALTIEEQRDRWRENIPDLFHGSYRRLYDKAIGGHSLRAAIDSKCLDCMCWQQAEVKKCTVVTCPLFLYRPYQDTILRTDGSTRGQIANEVDLHGLGDG